MNKLSSIIILAPEQQWDVIINNLPHDYQSLAVTIDRNNIEHTQQAALSVLLKAFHLSPIGHAALTNAGSQVYRYLEGNYPLYSQVKATLKACPLPTSNGASDFAAYQIRCDAIVKDYIKQGEQQTSLY